MFSPENHLDTRAASSPRDDSSSTLCTRTLSAFFLCLTLCCLCWIWLIDWRKTRFVSTFAKGRGKEDFTEVGTTLIWETYQTKKFKCLPSTIQVLFGRGRYLVEINIMTSSKLTHFNHPIKVELLLSQQHPHHKRFGEAPNVGHPPVVRVLLHVELGQLGLLLVVELLVRVRHGLPTRACNVFSVITEPHNSNLQGGQNRS